MLAIAFAYLIAPYAVRGLGDIPFCFGNNNNWALNYKETYTENELTQSNKPILSSNQL